jgi:hypothetical protein
MLGEYIIFLRIFSSYSADHTFVHYPPTMIASTAFLAVSRMAYPTKYNEIAHPTALARLGSKVC